MARSSTIANLLVYVGAETNDFFRGMGQVASKTASVAGGIAKFGLAAGAAVAAVGVAATKMAADFQDQMADVNTLLGKDSTTQLDKLGEEVKRISVLTGKDLSDVSGGLYETISAFGDTADAAKQLEIATKAAIGGKAETIDAVKMLSTVTKGYGDTSAAAVQKVADLAFQTANLGQTTFPELANEMGKVVPLAATLTVKQEELFGAMATLTGVTGNTAEVATQLRATMSALINPTSTMARKLSQLGFSNGKTMVETLGLQGTLDLLAKSTGGNTSELAKMFGSVEALNAVLALTGNQSADFTAKTQAMTEASGAADEAFRKKNETVNAMIGRLKQMGTVAMVELGEKFLPVVMKVGDWVMTNMPAIQGVMEQALNAVGVVVNWLGGVFNWLLENVLTPFVAAWAGDAEAMQTPIGQFALFVKGVWDAIAGFFLGFRDNIWTPFVAGWTSGSTSMGSIWQTTGALIGSIMKSIWDIVKGVWELLVLAWGLWGDEILAAARVVWELILGVIDGALKVIRGVINLFVALFKGDWQGMWDAIVMIWDGLWEIVSTVVDAAVKLVIIRLKEIADAVVGIFNLLMKAAGDLWGWASGWAADIAKAAIDWGASVMEGFWNGLSSWFSRIWDGLTSFANRVADTVKGALGIHSPSLVFAGIGENIGMGLALGIEGTAGRVSAALSEITPSVGIPAVAGAGGGGGGGQVHYHTYNVTVPAKDVAQFKDVVDFFASVRQVSRAKGSRR